MNGLNSVYLAGSGRKCELGAVIGDGAQGVVYEFQTDMAAKVFSVDELATANTAEKAHRMVENGSPDFGPHIVMWPTDLLTDKLGGKVIGFVMPRLPRDLVSLRELLTRNMWPAFAQSVVVRLLLTRNLASFVAVVHGARNIVLGDGLSATNLLFDPNGHLFAIDADSWQICFGREFFPCGVGNVAFAAPDLFGADLRNLRLTFAHDNWALAVAVYNIIAGRHPFDRVKTRPDAPSRATLIKEGKWPFAPNATEWGVAPPFPAQRDLFHPKMWQLFRRTFEQPGCTDDPSARPSAAEWLAAITSATQDLTFLSAIPTVEAQITAALKSPQTVTSSGVSVTAGPLPAVSKAFRSFRKYQMVAAAAVVTCLLVASLLFQICGTDAPPPGVDRDLQLPTVADYDTLKDRLQSDRLPQDEIDVPAFYSNLRARHERRTP